MENCKTVVPQIIQKQYLSKKANQIINIMATKENDKHYNSEHRNDRDD